MALACARQEIAHLPKSPNFAASSSPHSSSGCLRCEFSVGPEVGKLGLSFGSLAPCTVVVETVLPGFWAEREGIQLGETILAVNHRKTGEMTRQEFMKALRERPLELAVGRVQPKLEEAHALLVDEASQVGAAFSPEQPEAEQLFSRKPSEGENSTAATSDDDSSAPDMALQAELEEGLDACVAAADEADEAVTAPEANGMGAAMDNGDGGILGVRPVLGFGTGAVAAPPPQYRDVQRCVACQQALPRSDFAKAQLTKHRRSPKCRVCVDIFKR